MIPDLSGDPSLHPPWAEEQLAGLCGPSPTTLAPRPPCWGVGGSSRRGPAFPSPGPGEKLMLQLQSPLPAPSLSPWGDAGGPLLSHPRYIPGLAFFSCVGADTNVTAGHGTEGLGCGSPKGCTGEGVLGGARGAGSVGRERGSRPGWRMSGCFVWRSRVASLGWDAKDTRAGSWWQPARLGAAAGMLQLRDAAALGAELSPL